MADLLNNMNIDVLKVPLGFIRLLELPLVIISFLTACNYGIEVTYEASACGGNPVAFEFGYPFALTDLGIPTNSCEKADEREMSNVFHQSFTSQAQFFVFTGVVSLIYIVGSLAIYLFKWGSYENDKRYPMLDFLATGVLTVFWFGATLAWATALHGIKIVTNFHKLQETNLAKVDKACKRGNGCLFNHDWGYSSLLISVIAGFGCLIAFAGNLWFIYKETEWFKTRQSVPLGNYPENTQPPTDRPYS